MSVDKIKTLINRYHSSNDRNVFDKYYEELLEIFPLNLNNKAGNSIENKIISYEDKVFKIAKNERACIKLQMEVLLEDILTKYDIKYQPIEDVHPYAISRKRISNICLEQQNVDIHALKKLFHSSKRFSEETGLYLDLTADNFFYQDGEYYLFDLGLRTSKNDRRMKYTTNFKEYLQIYRDVQYKQSFF